MGGALDVFSDLTEEGNKWNGDSALPTHAEVLESLQAAEEEAEAAPRLEFMVADAPTSALRRSTARNSRLVGSKPDFVNMGDWLQRCKLRVELKSGKRKKWLFKFGRPEQVVVQGDGKEQSSTHMCSRPRSGTRLVPLHRVRALQRGTSGLLLSEERLMELQDHMPVVTRLANRWKLIYCPAVHGVSLSAFYRQCENWPGETLLIARDHKGVIFGGFATHTWRPSRSDVYFGSPECFVFTFGPPKEEEESGEESGKEEEEDTPATVHRWAGGEHHFMFADRTGFGMGGGNGFAFWVSEDLLNCSSAPSKTFNMVEPLASQRDVVLTTFECWSFDRGAPRPDPKTARLEESSEAGSPPRSPDKDRRSRIMEDAVRWDAFA